MSYGTVRWSARSRGHDGADVQFHVAGLVRTAVLTTTVCKGLVNLSASEVRLLEVETRPDRAGVIVTLRGQLDLESVDAVSSTLSELHGAGWERVVLDLRELTFI